MYEKLEKLLKEFLEEKKKTNKLLAINAALGIEQLGTPGSLMRNLFYASKDPDLDELKEILKNIQHAKDTAFRPGP